MSESMNPQEVTVDRRRAQWMWPAVVVAVAVIAAVVVIVLAGQGSPAPAAKGSATQSASPAGAAPVVTLDAASACVQLIPALEDGTTAVLAVVAQPDGSTVNRDALNASVATLTSLQTAAPQEMQLRIGDELAPLRVLQSNFADGVNQSLDLQQFKLSGVDLAEECRQYAN